MGFLSRSPCFSGVRITEEFYNKDWLTVFLEYHTILWYSSLSATSVRSPQIFYACMLHCLIHWIPICTLGVEKKNSMSPRRPFFPGFFWLLLMIQNLPRYELRTTLQPSGCSCRKTGIRIFWRPKFILFRVVVRECHVMLERLQSSPWLLYDLTSRLGSNWIQNSRGSQFFFRHTCTWQPYQNQNLILPILPVASPKPQGLQRVAHWPHRPLSRPRFCLKPRIRKQNQRNRTNIINKFQSPLGIRRFVAFKDVLVIQPRVLERSMRVRMTIMVDIDRQVMRTEGWRG